MERQLLHLWTAKAFMFSKQLWNRKQTITFFIKKKNEMSAVALAAHQNPILNSLKGARPPSTTQQEHNELESMGTEDLSIFYLRLQVIALHHFIVSSTI